MHLKQTGRYNLIILNSRTRSPLFQFENLIREMLFLSRVMELANSPNEQ